MTLRSQARDISAVLTVFVCVVSVAVAYFAREILIPIAVSALLSFALEPLVTRMSKYLGNTISVLASVIVLFCGIAGVGWLTINEFSALAGDYGIYKANVEARFVAAENSLPLIKKFRLSEKKDFQRKGAPAIAGATPLSDSLPEKLFDPQNVVRLATAVVFPIFSPLASGVVVLIFTIFMLIERKDLRNRVIRLIGMGELNRTTQALDDATSRLANFLGMQLMINAVYGTMVAIGLALIGIPGFVVWGVLATLLKYIPFIGSWVAAIIPVLLSLAVFPGWSHFIVVVTLFIVLELLTANVAEPWLFGATTGLAPIAVIFSAAFWTWLWGGIGLILAMPMTVCLSVLGRYVPRMSFLNILLNRDSVFSDSDRFYQRALALDADESLEICEEKIKEKGLAEMYDEVIVPALSRLKDEASTGMLDQELGKSMQQLLLGLVDDLQSNGFSKVETSQDSDNAKEISANKRTVSCVPARDLNDFIGASALSHALRSRGMNAEAASPRKSKHGLKSELLIRRPETLCIVAVQPVSKSRLRLLARKLKSLSELYDIYIVILGGQLPEGLHSRQHVDGDRVIRSITFGCEMIGGMECKNETNCPEAVPAKQVA